MFFASLDSLKLQIGLTGTADDALLNELVVQAEALIEELCGRSFLGGTFTEDHPGGGRIAFLRNYPITAVTEVKVDPYRQFGAETAMHELEYYVHPDTGLVESLGRPFLSPRPGWAVKVYEFPGTVRVTYSAPSSSVPPAVQRASVELVGHWYRQTKTHAATGQLNELQTTDGTTVTQYPWGQSGGFRLPASVLQLLEPYRVPRV